MGLDSSPGARGRLARARWTVNAVDNTFEAERGEGGTHCCLADWLAEWLAACAPTAPLISKSMPIKIEIVELVDDVLEPTKAAEP